VSEYSNTNNIAVILTALDVETAAVLRHLQNITTETVGGTGFFRGEFGRWIVAVAEIGAGNTASAAVAAVPLVTTNPPLHSSWEWPGE